MKKTVLLGALVVLATTAGFAQDHVLIVVPPSSMAMGDQEITGEYTFEDVAAWFAANPELPVKFLVATTDDVEAVAAFALSEAKERVRGGELGIEAIKEAAIEAVRKRFPAIARPFVIAGINVFAEFAIEVLDLGCTSIC